ncbi:hypothetical protein LOD47_09395 [Xylella fastidiosa subsp. multiplex]|nr:hypothetical protein [Xylella fastidiosa]MDD0868443.1 hypothetical protein [Xylella fastidiosa subsp. multiplex]MDD0907870.1 hypothetical protein [Xylella fastidiosa subsp. multiplex]MDD0918973.1 hypothetical protein [Xylella fastidiosa subsp. multiplex]MDD0950396.1 hypothetical protein [Xylella fastidiosa subsp. multiplex]MDD0952627.1 hypothetical protein [Xylella fastidiosa subsp. multiplex]
MPISSCLLIVALLLWISTGLGGFFYGQYLGIQTTCRAQVRTAHQGAR